MDGRRRSHTYGWTVEAEAVEDTREQKGGQTATSLYGSVSPKSTFTRQQTPWPRPRMEELGSRTEKAATTPRLEGRSLWEREPQRASLAGAGAVRTLRHIQRHFLGREADRGPGCCLPPTWMPCKCCPWAELSQKPQPRPLGQAATLEELQNGDKWVWEPGPGRAQQPRSRAAQGASTRQSPVPQRAAALRSMSPGLGEEERR